MYIVVTSLVCSSVGFLFLNDCVYRFCFPDVAIPAVEKTYSTGALDAEMQRRS